ncbi:hypothetical protein Tco_1217586 [Tanacetum coccineum]
MASMGSSPFCETRTLDRSHVRKIQIVVNLGGILIDIVETDKENLTVEMDMLKLVVEVECFGKCVDEFDRGELIVYSLRSGYTTLVIDGLSSGPFNGRKDHSTIVFGTITYEVIWITALEALMSIWKAFGGNTHDLGSFGEETDKTTDLHQNLLKNILTEREDGVASIKRRRHDLQSDDVSTLVTPSEHGRPKETLEDSVSRD